MGVTLFLAGLTASYFGGYTVGVAVAYIKKIGSIS